MFLKNLTIKIYLEFKYKYSEYPHFVNFLANNGKTFDLDKKYHGCIVKFLSSRLEGSLEDDEWEEKFDFLCNKLKKQYNISNRDLLDAMVRKDRSLSEPLLYYLLNTKDLSKKDIINYWSKLVNHRFEKYFSNNNIKKFTLKNKQAVFNKLEVKSLDDDLLYDLQIIFFKRLMMGKDSYWNLEFLEDFSSDDLNNIMKPIDINKNNEIKDYIESNFNFCEFFNTSHMNCADFIVLSLSNNYKVCKDSLLKFEDKEHYLSFLELLTKNRKNIFGNKIFFVQNFILNTIENCGYEFDDVRVLKDEFFRTVKELQEKDFEGKEQIFYYDFLKKVRFHLRIDSKSNVREFFKLVCEKINVEKIKLIRELPMEIEELNLVIKELQEKKNTLPIKRKLK